MIEKLVLIAAFALVACACASAAEEARVAGTVRDEKGKTIREATVYLAKGDACLTAQSDRKGRFEFDGVKPGTYDYLAVSLPPEDDPRRQRFPYLFARKALEVKPGETLQADVTYAPPQLPAPVPLVVDAPDKLDGPDGRSRTKFIDVSIANPFSWHWERQRVGFRLKVEAGFAPNSVIVYDPEAKAIVPSQLNDEVCTEKEPRLATSAVVHFLAEVQPNSHPVWRIYYDTGEFKPSWHGLRALDVSAFSTVLGMGKVSAKLPVIPDNRRQSFKGKPASEAPPPLLAVSAGDDNWIGAGRLAIDDTVEDITSHFVEIGPIFCEYCVSYRFASGSFYRVTFRFEAEAPFFTVKEESDGEYGIEPGSGGAFEFSAYPGLQPDQGYEIHWGLRPKNPAYDADATLARIGNYMHIMSFGYAAASSRDDAKNALAVFSVNRGAWIDRRYAVDTWFPLRRPAWRSTRARCRRPRCFRRRGGTAGAGRCGG
ncbi:MAG TPA: carboxypeptidase-like regulatory domain-containing protein [Planctomycetota bacterium]|nr:carboxypeptidase-like regulatory domain-containing protein [Planctomycetota bacterium]